MDSGLTNSFEVRLRGLLANNRESDWRASNGLVLKLNPAECELLIGRRGHENDIGAAVGTPTAVERDYYEASLDRVLGTIYAADVVECECSGLLKKNAGNGRY